MVLFSCCKEKEVQAPPQEIQVFEVVPKTVPLYEEFVGQVYGAKDIPINLALIVV